MPEVTENFVRVPVNSCKITATINISKEKGISALYCGNEKKIATYLFSRKKGWSMSKAKAWVSNHKNEANMDYREHDLKELKALKITENKDRSKTSYGRWIFKWNESYP